MPTDARLLRPLTRRRADVDPHRAESRVAAYVYGNVLVLAAVAAPPRPPWTRGRRW